MNPILKLAEWSARKLPETVKRQLYTIPGLAHLLRRVLNRAAPTGESEVVIASGGLAGFHMLLDLQREKDYWLGTYEPDLQAAVVEFVKPGMVVFDVGANIGYISLLLARQVGETGKVFSFEALPTNLERLRQNILLNDFPQRIEIIPAAVVESSRTVRFLVGPSTGMGKADGSAGRMEYDYQDSLSVNGLSLDSFIDDLGHPPPQVIKLDIEGGEVLALPGMRRLLKKNRPLILMELHGPLSAKVAIDEFSMADYQLKAMEPGFPDIDISEELDWKSYLVAIPKPGDPIVHEPAGRVSEELSGEMDQRG